ncbi:MAG TPA: protein translocase subunit SecF [Spirochaetota bacterium]|nr:protein translocase subunit SecF [Spirochaetota bacterium]HOM38693.1 protein translocase subunit SecF [Spirochaetota bacterium]HPQ49791.1 protein translocase subunit SecF [Spirochaetota bacterium]
MVNNKFDFIKASRIAVIISLFFIIATVIGLFTKGMNLGIDFMGGKTLRVKFSKDINISPDILRNSLKEIGPRITNVGKDEKEYIISYKDEKFNVKTKLTELFQDKYEILSEDFVGPKIGKEFQSMAYQATIVILIIILIYIGIRFKFKFGVAAVIALLHDVILTLGFITYTGYEFDITLLASVLTIIGYSLNDTIVIFDRIREEVKTHHLGKEDYSMVVNLSINKSLTRTFLTSLTTLVALVALLIFAGIELKAMAATLIFGIIVGTYSSNFIASPVVLAWEKIKKRSGSKKTKKS